MVSTTHDQLTADDFTNVGFSTAWSYSDHSAFSFSYSKDIAGRVGHKVDSTYAVGYAYNFGYH